MMTDIPDKKWLLGLLNPEAPGFCLQARLAMDDEALSMMAREILPTLIKPLSKVDRDFLDLTASRFIRKGGAIVLSRSELVRVFACREALDYFEAAANACAEANLEATRFADSEAHIEGESDVLPTSLFQTQSPFRSRIASGLSLPIGLVIGSAAASLVMVLYLVLLPAPANQSNGVASTPLDAPSLPGRPSSELLTVGEFQVAADHEHGMCTGVYWKGAQEPGLRANPFHEYFSSGYCGLFGVHIDAPLYREAAQPETKLLAFEQSPTGFTCVYENTKYGRKGVTFEHRERVLYAACDLKQCLVPVRMTVCGDPIFFKRVYLLTPGREANFNLAYQGEHRNFLDEKGNSVPHSEILLTNDSGSYAWLYRVSPGPRPAQMSTSAGLNGPVWQLQPGDRIEVMIGAESDLRRYR